MRREAKRLGFAFANENDYIIDDVGDPAIRSAVVEVGRLALHSSATHQPPCEDRRRLEFRYRANDGTRRCSQARSLPRTRPGF